ncbi:OLC1v1000665C1 [Oldenlandia corymbosa var. corymbosa]|uniref:OLC1v1000665C1 n=1 Tax=Oldenlandia corymbosa var. corymbosa TaxID=529605 RepID=A0AAV1D6Y1_OLDCO|nr:OLC1v1000665C1 [Oldenlandia corymbosa var. corymbosa]
MKPTNRERSHRRAENVPKGSEAAGKRRRKRGCRRAELKDGKPAHARLTATTGREWSRRAEAAKPHSRDSCSTRNIKVQKAYWRTKIWTDESMDEIHDFKEKLMLAGGYDNEAKVSAIEIQTREYYIACKRCNKKVAEIDVPIIKVEDSKHVQSTRYRSSTAHVKNLGSQLTRYLDELEPGEVPEALYQLVVNDRLRRTMLISPFMMLNGSEGIGKGCGVDDKSVGGFTPCKKSASNNDGDDLLKHQAPKNEHEYAIHA